MELSFAPMEGVTSCIYRQVHKELFGGADRYYAPFLAPDGQGKVKLSALRDVLPENNEGLLLVPQILCSAPGPFLALADELAAMGFDEVNLNAGCPSGTVVPKHKGAGMLGDPAALDAFLNEVFSRCPIRVSVKTRLGLERTDEFVAILEVYKRYPLAELIVHARDRRGLYQSVPDLDAFRLAYEGSRAPLVYNGNILCPATYNYIMSTFPDLEAVCIGRGAAANPALFRVLRGGEKLRIEELRSFFHLLIERTLAYGISEHFTLGHMKELLYYVNHMFPGAKRELKQLQKASDLKEFDAALALLLDSGRFDPDASFPGTLPGLTEENA